MSGHGQLERYDDGCRCGLCVIAKCRDDQEWRARCRESRPKAQCGTRSGYERHRNLGEPTCPACRDAMAAYQRRYRARGKVAPLRRGPMNGIRRIPLWPPPNTFDRCERDCGRLVWDFDRRLCGACAA